MEYYEDQLNRDFDNKDIKAFTSGGCHMFALALAAEMAKKGNSNTEFLRVSVVYEVPGDRIRRPEKFSEKGHHVLIKKNGLLIDVKGCRDESEYRNKLIRYLTDEKYAQEDSITINIDTVAGEDLKKKSKEHSQLGWCNDWKLMTGGEIMLAGEKFAKKIIASNPEKYGL